MNASARMRVHEACALGHAHACACVYEHQRARASTCAHEHTHIHVHTISSLFMAALVGSLQVPLRRRGKGSEAVQFGSRGRAYVGEQGEGPTSEGSLRTTGGKLASCGGRPESWRVAVKAVH